MTARFGLPDGPQIAKNAKAAAEALETSERALKNFRYVVASVDEDALRAWADLWKELKDGVTPAGVVLPKLDQGFTPACGWPEFLEKFWLLKHYLDYLHHFSTTPTDDPSS